MPPVEFEPVIPVYGDYGVAYTYAQRKLPKTSVQAWLTN